MGALLDWLHPLRPPRRCYAVCAIPRSGSNLLTDGLYTTQHAGRPKQFFLHTFEARYGAKHGLDPEANYAAYLRGIVNKEVTSNGVFGFKLMSWYLERFLGRLRTTEEFGAATTSDVELLQNAFPHLRFVRIVRRNKLRQAISKARAAQTGVWKITAGRTNGRDAQFNRELIAQCLRDGEHQEVIWDRFFARAAVDAYTVYYEELCENYEETLRRVLDFLSIPPRHVTIGSPRTIRQADAISDDWERRYQPVTAAPQKPAPLLSHV